MSFFRAFYEQASWQAAPYGGTPPRVCLPSLDLVLPAWGPQTALPWGPCAPHLPPLAWPFALSLFTAAAEHLPAHPWVSAPALSAEETGFS